MNFIGDLGQKMGWIEKVKSSLMNEKTKGKKRERKQSEAKI